MKQFDLVGEGIKLIFKDNILAVLSDSSLTTVSSAFHNGGFQKTNVIVNAQVPKEYNDSHLHQDPEQFIQNCFSRLELQNAKEFVGMITFAVVEAFSMVSACDDDIAVSVVATGGCTHAESAGEKFKGSQPAAGTINLIVVIDGNPTDSCLVSSIITATEAKSAALKELDVRSLYTGNEATGTPTDAIVVAKTGKGAEIVYSGPISKLGRLIACCTKQAVREAVAKAPIGGYPLARSMKRRLEERHLALDKLAAELAEVESLGQDEKAIAAELAKLLEDPAYAAFVFSASELSDRFTQGAFPVELGSPESLGKKFGELRAECKQPEPQNNLLEGKETDLPAFFRQAIIAILRSRFTAEKY
jgi:adenosylcobinamide amidohydrolase